MHEVLLLSLGRFAVDGTSSASSRRIASALRGYLKLPIEKCPVALCRSFRAMRAVWAGVTEVNSSKNEVAEIKGTMGKEGRSFTYQARVRLLADGSASLKVHVQEDGAMFPWGDQ